MSCQIPNASPPVADSPISTPISIGTGGSSPSCTPVLSSSFGLSPLGAAAAVRSPKFNGGTSSSRNMHAYEVKSQRKKATKNHMRAAVKDEGNVLFVDVLHWLKDVDEVPLSSLHILIEDMTLPHQCRPASWGLPCTGCNLEHSTQLKLRHGKQFPKPPAWMRSPPYLPGLTDMPFLEVDAIWASAPDHYKKEIGEKIQFVTFEGTIIWGRDLGEDSGHIFRAFLSEMQSGTTHLDDFALPVAAVNVNSSVVECPEEAWQKVFGFLTLREVVQTALAFSSNESTRDSLERTWDPRVLLRGMWPQGAGCLRLFLSAALATYFAELVFCGIPRTPGLEDALREDQCRTSNPLITCSGAHPRSITVSARPTALALSRGSRIWEGLLAIAIGKEIKLIRRYDMKSCGTLALRGCQEVGSMILSPDSSILAVVPRAEFGTTEVQFYPTESKTKPVVAALESTGLLCVDFLNGDSLGSDGMRDLVATCGTELCQISPLTGEVVASWHADADRAEFVVCKAVTPHEVITLADKTVEVWDLRTANGVVKHAKAIEPVTALDASTFGNSSILFLGDAFGGLHSLDWRGSPSVSEVLWKAPKLWNSQPTYKLMVERKCACLIADPSLTMLSLEHNVVPLGSADVRGRLSAIATVPGVWAFATHMSSARKSQSFVALIEPSGKIQKLQNKQESSEMGAKKPVKMFRKTELKGLSDRHGRNSAKAARGGSGR